MKEYEIELNKKNVEIITCSRVIKIHSKSVTISDRPLIGGGNERCIAADSVVLACGMKPENSLIDKHTKRKGTWYKIGDCRNPRNVFKACHEAFELGIKI